MASNVPIGFRIPADLGGRLKLAVAWMKATGVTFKGQKPSTGLIVVRALEVELKKLEKRIGPFPKLPTT